MALRSEAQWKQFFTTAGITDDTTSTTYAKTFSDNGFNERSLQVLDKATLTQVGITLLGQQLAILQYAGELRSNTQSQSTSVTKASITAHLSTLTLEMTRPQFRKFKQDWLVYKQITHLRPEQSTAHLYNACNEEVQISLISTNPDFVTLDEDAALAVIEPIVTIRSNPAVHRKAFGELKQEENQTIKNFVVRLRSAATDCAFQCPNDECKQDLSSINIMDQFIRGLNNHNLQAEILAKTNQLKSVDDVIAHAESFEAALRDQTNLANNTINNIDHETDTAFKFSHKKKRNTNNTFSPPSTCNGCGGEFHNRTTECKAWGKDCNNCGIANHFASVCRKKGPINDGQQG